MKLFVIAAFVVAVFATFIAGLPTNDNSTDFSLDAFGLAKRAAVVSSS